MLYLYNAPYIKEGQYIDFIMNIAEQLSVPEHNTESCRIPHFMPTMPG
jgi:hypothetical protein